MADEEKKAEGTPEAKSDQEYLDEIEHLRDTTVSKEEYAKLKATNNELLKRLAKGDFDPQQEKPEEVDLNALRKSIFQGSVTNLEYVKNALKLREEIIKKEGKDIFLPYGHNYTASQEDIDKAQNVADVLQECVEESDGNSQVFTAILQSRLNEPAFVRYGRRK